MIKIGPALFEACEELEQEKGISKDVIIASLCDAMVTAYKKHIKAKEATNVEAILVEESCEIGVFRNKVVVENVEDPDTEISLDFPLGIVYNTSVVNTRRCDGIGRRAGLKIRWW